MLDAYRQFANPITQAIANAIAGILDGKVTYFEIEHRAGPGGEAAFLTSVAALRGDGAGAILMHKAVGEGRRPDPPLSSAVRTTNGGSINLGFSRLTPREREVLDLMAVGLDNRAIAAKLEIQYTTVRGHVRSVIEKIGARSRLEAVARAYQLGLVPV